MVLEIDQVVKYPFMMTAFVASNVELKHQIQEKAIVVNYGLSHASSFNFIPQFGMDTLACHSATICGSVVVREGLTFVFRKTI